MNPYLQNLGFMGTPGTQAGAAQPIGSFGTPGMQAGGAYSVGSYGGPGVQAMPPQGAHMPPPPWSNPHGMGGAQNWMPPQGAAPWKGGVGYNGMPSQSMNTMGSQPMNTMGGYSQNMNQMPGNSQPMNQMPGSSQNMNTMGYGAPWGTKGLLG